MNEVGGSQPPGAPSWNRHCVNLTAHDGLIPKHISDSQTCCLPVMTPRTAVIVHTQPCLQTKNNTGLLTTARIIVSLRKKAFVSKTLPQQSLVVFSPSFQPKSARLPAVHAASFKNNVTKCCKIKASIKRDRII